jgi:glycosyltransferase involved in cell wall biosynthesis
MAKVSVLLPTYNEEDKIRQCLESVKWADEILVVDSFSTDRTLEIASEYGARIIQHEYINSAKQKNWAIPQCRYEWVLQIDADERVEPVLQEEIRRVLQAPPPDVDGYRMPFKHHMFGQWVRVGGLYPEQHLRLFRRDKGRFQDREVDAHVVVPGRVETLRNHVLHYGMESVSRRLRELDRYTRYEADERFKRGRRFSWASLVLRPIATFCYYYFCRLGLTAGVRGLMLAVHKTDFIFWTYAKLWEKEWQQGKRR